MSKVITGNGFRIELERADERATPYHKRIVRADPIPNTKTGRNCTLECGHRVQTYGPIEQAGGVTLCQECRSHGR